VIRRVPARITWLAALGILAADCSSAPAGSGAPGGSTGATPGGSAPAASAASSSGVPAGFVVGPGSFSMAEPAAGLDTITTYRATLKKSFTGTVDGASSTWSVTAEHVHVADENADRLTVETTGSAPENPGEVVSVAGVVYAVVPGRDCVAGTIEGAESTWNAVELARSIPPVVGAEAAGTDTIGGIAANHFTFDQRAVGIASPATASGEVWTAAEGGHLLKYALRVEGGPEYFGTGTTGTATWEYELFDLNASIAIAIPEGCPAGLVDAPTLPDATSVVSGPGLLSYTTATDIKGVMSFYEGRAQALGWTRTSEPLSDKEIGVLEYSSAQGAVTVLVQTAAGTTTVRIVVDPGTGG
jgi:hypothetical protein